MIRIAESERGLSMYVCICNALTDKELSEVAYQGARTVDDAFRMLGTEVCCGQCRCMAEDVIESTPVKSADCESQGPFVPDAYVLQAAE